MLVGFTERIYFLLNILAYWSAWLTTSTDEADKDCDEIVSLDGVEQSRATNSDQTKPEIRGTAIAAANWSAPSNR